MKRNEKFDFNNVSKKQKLENYDWGDEEDDQCMILASQVYILNRFYANTINVMTIYYLASRIRNC